jgi:ATP-dependent DNA ligase
LNYDGFRVLAANEGDEVRLVSRRSTNSCRSRRLPERATRAGAYGELVMLDERGRPEFEALRPEEPAALS